MISFPCSHCRKSLRVKDELAGKRGKCPACGKPIMVPSANEQLVGAGTETGSRSPVPTKEAERTLPPKPLPQAGNPQDSPTLAPANAPRGAAEPYTQETLPGLNPVKPITNPATVEHPPELTEFLAPPQAPDEIGRLGPYRVLAILGYGGMGVVFRAEDPGLERQVALKAMLPSLASNPANRARFLREAKAAAAVKDDHVVSIFQISEDRGVPFAAMEFLEGEPLDVRIKQGPKLTVAEIARIGRETALGLAAAHKRGLIHRDIKPGNLWLEGERARVKILDFGLARAMSDETHLTQSGAIIGTPAYMSPEQADGRGVDHRTDLFSLGCVLYRLCTGETPFKGNGTLAIISALALETPKPPRDINPEVPAELSDIVMQVLAKKPEQRPESAQAVADALQEIEAKIAPGVPRAAAKTRQGQSRSTKPVTAVRTQSAAPAKKQPPVAWLLGGGVLGLSVLGFVLFLMSRPRDNQANRERELPEAGAAQQPETLPASFTNSLGMKMAFIPPGEFAMGSTAEEIDRVHKERPNWMPAELIAGEGPQHPVKITRPFYMGVYEVKVREFRTFVEATNYKTQCEREGTGAFLSSGRDPKANWRSPGWAQGDDHPITCVSWSDTQDFCAWLSQKEGKAYRLPTEAEWEYACRGGTTTSYYCGDTLSSNEANFQGDHPFGGAAKGPARVQAIQVGTFAPNSFGLYDMHGNVWEWCADAYDEKFYARSPKEAPTGPESRGKRGILRGGSFANIGIAARSAFRGPHDYSEPTHDIGFRLVHEWPRLTPARVPVGKEPVAAPPAPPVEKKAETLPPTFKNSIGMEFVLVPKGKSWLGGGGGKPGDKEVEIADDFYLGKYEVTQEEWGKLMGSRPSNFCRAGPGKDAVKDISDEELKRFPVESVSWDDGQLFLTELNKREQEAGWLYRLPKETEWEYACRGGPMADRLDSTSDFYFEKPSDVLLPDQANFNNVLKRTCKVGSYKPNRLGLYDMHGNVWEWCYDLFDPKDPARASHRVFRGGSWWIDDSGFCRAAYRGADPPSARNFNLGLRVARVPVGK